MTQIIKNIIFPKNVNAVVADILSTYNVGETKEEQIAKMKNGKWSTTALVASLIGKRAKNELSENDLIAELKKLPKVTTKIAPLMAKDIENKIIALVKTEKEITAEKTLPVKIKLPPKSTSSGNDVYREPVA